jgi:hypothetical protein
MSRIRTVALGFLLLLTIAATAVAGNAAPKEKRNKAAVDEARASATLMPTVALDQTRPRAIVANTLQEPDPSGTGGGYTAGACNCSRDCPGGASLCQLATSNKSCKSPCQSCLNSSCP